METLSIEKINLKQKGSAITSGAKCIRLVSNYFNHKYSLKSKNFEKDHALDFSIDAVSDFAEKVGLRSMVTNITFDTMEKECSFPCIVHWKASHFIVINKVKNSKIFITDPLLGDISYSLETFKAGWLTSNDKLGEILMLSPSNVLPGERLKADRFGFSFIYTYAKHYKKYIFQIIIGMLISSLLGLVFPFLTQSIVDVGIENRDFSFITMILFAQLALFLSTTAIKLITKWLDLHVGTRVSVSFVSDFIMKVLKLPISFVESRELGDILQRIRDNTRIEEFINVGVVNLINSIFSIVLYSFVLAYYNLTIFFIYYGGVLLYGIWIALFLKKRRRLNFEMFTQNASNQTTLIQLFEGMREIKLYNIERLKRWYWEEIQAKKFKIQIKSLILSQYQESGAEFIYQSFNMIITFTAAYSVINGDMTLGMLLAVQFIVGLLDSPMEDIIDLTTSAQDARISLERVREVYDEKNEEDDNKRRKNNLPKNKDIKITNLSFSYNYEVAQPIFALRDISLDIKEGQKIALVGSSGSGKTTLLALLLKFYNAPGRNIEIGDYDFNDLNISYWRSKCGAVLQNGIIFSDTLVNNINISEEIIDEQKLRQAIDISRIQEFIERLPSGIETLIGPGGHGLSQGQKQRILIARAVYKNPEFMFFDEATSSLDAKNEKEIVERLKLFLKGKTVITVAHRLSTVIDADQIFVLDKGRIVERGNHDTLAKKRGFYYDLIKNQLELGG